MICGRFCLPLVTIILVLHMFNVYVRSCSLCLKIKDTWFLVITWQICNEFQNSFTDRFPRKFCTTSTVSFVAFSALTLLVKCEKEHLAYINWVVRCWRGYLVWSEMQMISLIPLPPRHLSNKIQIGLTFMVPVCLDLPRLSWQRGRLMGVCLSLSTAVSF